MEPTGQTDHDVLTSIPVLATVDSSILATTDVHSVMLDRVDNFNPYIDRVQPFLKGVITRAAVIKATHILQQHNCPFRPVSLVPPEEWASFLSLLKRGYSMDEVKRNECNDWQSWSISRFCEELKEAVPNVTEAQAQIMGFEQMISRVMINFDLQDPSLENETDLVLDAICEVRPEVTTEAQLAAVLDIKKKLPKSPTNWQSILTRKIDGKPPKLETIEQFRFVWLKQLKTRQFKEQPSTLLPTKSSNKRARTQDDDKSTEGPP